MVHGIQDAGFNEAGADAPEIQESFVAWMVSGAGFNEAGADAPEIQNLHP